MQKTDIVDSNLPASEVVGEAAIVIDDELQDDGKVYLVVDELLGTLGKQRMGMWVQPMDPIQFRKPMWKKLINTSCKLMRWIKWLAKTFWMTRSTS